MRQVDIADFCGSEFALTPAQRRSLAANAPKRSGYAFPPGTGPAGETCSTCRHIWRSDKFRKCSLRKSSWTHGYATDILAKSPACKAWEREKSE